jgi:hypothetical protein
MLRIAQSIHRVHEVYRDRLMQLFHGPADRLVDLQILIDRFETHYHGLVEPQIESVWSRGVVG